MKYEIYRGQIVSQENVLWEVRISQEMDHAPSEIGVLDMPADEPLTIEWSESSKEDVVISSIATLRLISPGDRTYEGLYSIKPGSIRLDVYREGALYWSGTLDPEFYEEPYTTTEGYEVELSFSDFGILDRLKYDLTGMQNCRTLLNYILERSEILHNGMDETYITTEVQYPRITEVPPVGWFRDGLRQFDVRSDNWYDEDGEASSLRDVVEGILQPLALRMEQRNGKVWIYDLNGAYNMATKNIEWMSDDQMLGVDKVLNNVKITFSTYSSAKLLETEVSSESKGTPNTNYYYVDLDPDTKVSGNWDSNYKSFEIDDYYVPIDTGLAYNLPAVKFFHIRPLLGADESTGIAYMFMTGGHGALTTGWPQRIGADPALKTETVLMRTHRFFVPKLSKEEQKKYYIRLMQEILVDCRYNPFTDADAYNERSNQKNMTVWFGYVMIPAAMNLYDEQGNAIYHYTNREVAQSTDCIGNLYYKTLGEWVAGPASWGDMWLEWYDKEDRSEKSGVGGWQGNRHNIGLSTKGMFKSFTSMEDGQYIPYPPVGGYIDVTIYIGIWPYDYKRSDTFLNTAKANKEHMYEKLRWLLYKLPKVELVRKNAATGTTEEMDDVEYNSYINPDAKEELELETKCGTALNTSPTSKAMFFDDYTMEMLSKVKRAGRNKPAEELLLGTLYSQFAERKTKLTGTMRINAGNPTLLVDASLPNKKLIVLGDVQDVQADTSEIVAVELRPDEYKHKNE